jgi:hypothetical protein
LTTTESFSPIDSIDFMTANYVYVGQPGYNMGTRIAKRGERHYLSGRSPAWIKVNTPNRQRQ